ncbi:hypothetical protein C8A05DRAFT_47327 [Staphylotrichum tortipilum]|uniref:Nephrocystin 3-like N-terminal domain-containing protein n=1 Tax=Staphylotrichum tortipilum TaxID=2831512 RepID=A0AAN6RQE0_9PEZI|nr:hypothetical protein C8A05DRAFT_47327 [Staphylotrichum longicolle]
MTNDPSGTYRRTATPTLTTLLLVGFCGLAQARVLVQPGRGLRKPGGRCHGGRGAREDFIQQPRQQSGAMYKRPPPERDRLYKADIVHPLHPPDGCHVECGNDEALLVVRDARDEEDDDPTIHYGLVASASQLMKDARFRDKLADDKGVLCFEMEAAGLMNHFSCLVIRGICDYSDSHTNKEWQGFAAMLAAAYAKDLLHQIPPNKVEEERRIREVLSSGYGRRTGYRHIRPKISNIHAGVDSLKSDNHLHKLKTWLWPPDPSTNRITTKVKRQEGTGNWFVTSIAFLECKLGSRRHLWLYSLAGCGKTALTSTIFDHLYDAQPDPCVCLEFFFDFRDKNNQYLDNMLRSLTFQLYSQCTDARKDLDTLFTSCDDGRKQPETVSLSRTVHGMMQHPQKLQIILDALDECVTRTELLDWMKTLVEEELESGLSGWIHNDNRILIGRDSTNEDIRSYVKARLQRSEKFQKRWASEPFVLEEIESVIGGELMGCRLGWAAYQLDGLEGCLDYDELESALHSLPHDLDDTYSRILRKAVDAIAIPFDAHRQFDPKYRLPCPNEIAPFCSSLVSLVTRRSDEETVMELELAHFFSFPMQDFRTGCEELHNTMLPSLPLCPETEAPIYDVRAQFLLARYSAQYWMDHAKPAETVDGIAMTGLNATAWMLLEKDADVNAQGGLYGNALLAASSGGNKEIAKMLLEKDQNSGRSL